MTLDVLIGNLRSANVSSIQDVKDYFRYSTFQRPFYPGKSNGEGEPWVFIYTEGAGWIDIVHFVNGALSGLVLGEATEVFQSITGNLSAWSYEDLQSNLQGSLYRIHHGLSGDDFLDNLEKWFEGLGATSSEVAPNWVNVPPSSAATKGYGDDGNGGNKGLPIPQNHGYIPRFTPSYELLPSKYKIETYNRIMHNRGSGGTHSH